MKNYLFRFKVCDFVLSAVKHSITTIKTQEMYDLDNEVQTML